MDPILQSDLHPDADQLSALIENALAAPEREQTLAHLAVCADCRAIVSLAMPDAPVVEPVSVPRPEPKSWLAPWRNLSMGWRFALPATACALLAGAALLLRPSTPPPPGPTAVTTAQLERAPSPPAAASAAAPAGEQRAEPSARKPVEPGKQATASAIGPTRATPQVALDQSSRMLSAPLPPIAQPAAPQSFARAENQTVPLARSSAASLLPQQKAVPAGAPATNTDVTVEAAAGVPLPAVPRINAAPLAPAAAASAALRLPSGRPLLSSSASAGHLVAIDSDHAVFVSSDSGQSWSAVHARWSGRPVRVEGLRPTTPAAQASVAMAAPMASGAPVTARNVAGAGSISGGVSDASGAAIPNALITLDGSGNAPPRIIKTDAGGHFTLLGVASGPHQLQATAPGFETTSVQLEVKPGAASSADLHLQTGAVSESVTVSADIESMNAAIEQRPSRKERRRAAALASPTVFTLTTDSGTQWISADGLHWSRQ